MSIPKFVVTQFNSTPCVNRVLQGGTFRLAEGGQPRASSGVHIYDSNGCDVCETAIVNGTCPLQYGTLAFTNNVSLDQYTIGASFTSGTNGDLTVGSG